MTTIYDVPADEMIAKTALKLKDIEDCQPPEWAQYVKTAVHREKAPKDPEWWYTREAAILRKVYIDGPIGTMHLRAKFSGPLDRGSKPNRTRMGSGSIIRTALQQLEKAEFIAAINGKGREVTPKGRKFLDNIAYDVLKDIIKENPELGKY